MAVDQLESLVDEIESSNLVSGDPGNWSFDATPCFFSTVGVRGASAISTDEQALVQHVIKASNAAAETIPSAATDQNVSSDTSRGTITDILNALYINDPNIVGEIGDDITAIQAGGKAHLHWWG